MYRVLFLASVAHATLQQQGQIPLQAPGRDVVEALTLTHDLRYIFPSSDEFSHARLESLGDAITHHAHSASSIIVQLPLDATLAGTVTFSSNTSDTLEPAIWMTSTSHVELEHVGIRKGGMIAMPVSSPAVLALDSPYIKVPKEIFDVLLQAAETSPGQNYVVDCGLMSRFPDLVFGVDAGDEGDEEDAFDAEEVVVTPEQYVLESEGQCRLLARSAESGRVALGWAAVRGRKFVLDLARGRMGLL